MTIPIYPSDSRKAFGKSDRAWLCLTTLHHRRFIEDAIHVVGLPPGAHVRLRYRRQYIDDALWLEVADNLPVERELALVTLAATNKAGENEVAPLRIGRIVAARCEGSLLTVDIALREFVYEVYPMGTFYDEIKGLARNLPNRFGSKTTGTFVQRLPVPPESLVAGSGVAAWERAADTFFRIDTTTINTDKDVKHRAIPFLYYIAPRFSKMSSGITGRGELHVEAGSTTRFDIHTIAAPVAGKIRNPLGEVHCDLAHPAATFVSSRRVRIDSRRDLRTVSVSTTALFRRKYGHFSVRTVYFDYEDGESDDSDTSSGTDSIASADGRTEVVAARYDFPMAVGRLMPWIASLLVAAAGAVATYKAPKGSDLEVFKPIAVFILALLGLVSGWRGQAKGE